MKRAHHKLFRKKRDLFLIASAVSFALLGCIVLWLSSFNLPDLSSFDTRVVTQSTKIYDRTGKILLYDVHDTNRRTVVPFEKISPNIKNATVAIEDENFYQHNGIEIKSILRAVLANLTSAGYAQGGSTITQQVVKNAILTGDKSISRKIKEWVLALKLEKIKTKDEILDMYLNESPYGGNIYGVQEATQAFFGKDASDVTLAEAAYIAALPQAPSLYSPFGSHQDKLETRKNLVLLKMKENGFISDQEYTSAKAEKVSFQSPSTLGIKAPHFVFFVRQYLEDTYGEDVLLRGGLKVTTTLDYDMEQKAEGIVRKYAFENVEKFNAKNAALVAIDPKTGQILSMVGSRDYFDNEIDGNFNVVLAKRQPGSTFKPFSYATAFKKGFTPETVLFDVPTQFDTSCTPDGKQLNDPTATSTCYMPENYDGKYLGPLTMREALAQSRNIPAIKTLYLAGIADSLRTAKDLGITSLTNANQYGLTLVLGGGEVSLLELTNAYGVFADNGTRNPYSAILKVEDANGNILENYEQKQTSVLDPDIAQTITSILSDDTARLPAYGRNSPLFFPDRDVAVKTGTTNDYKDVWIVGYTPNLVVGAWAGNNDNSSMEKKVAGLIIAPLWHTFMQSVFQKLPIENFTLPTTKDISTLKPVLRGIWQGGETQKIDTRTGLPATDTTPVPYQQERIIPNVHDILYWINKNDPRGPAPANPSDDSQFNLWEYGVQEWLKANPFSIQNTL